MRNLPNFQQARFEICFQLTKGLLVSVYSGNRNHASSVVSEKSVQRMINATERKERKLFLNLKLQETTSTHRAKGRKGKVLDSSKLDI